MQWTDESGEAYGEDPYGGGGYTYGYGHEYDASATADTAAMSWEPVQPAQWTHPMGNAHWTDPYASGAYLYAAGPGPATTAWEAAHGDVLTVPPVTTAWDAACGDVLTVPPPELNTPGPPIPEPDARKSESVRPVFVDSSGRRQRRVKRAAWLLVIPAGGYVALLISTVFGGPSLNAPFVPQPEPKHLTTPRVSAPDTSPGTDHSAGSVSPTAAEEESRPTTAPKTSSSTDRSTASAASATTPVPSAAPTTVASPTAIATPRPTSKGRAVGSSHNPVK
ncbi:hypothetical protein [Streptomyces brasiliensis]|uniref:Uncharacterized protein n=1 Tax=Streptomyces brasiliensis TaxID=1954 RepID=A0A917PDJ6_9ACTN|nr:hypothetical protein [Streptomyces brasiliensis]GGJ72077.1 hypothetical protein GCM10010121_098290 [Streptomyces brasiliensis]